VKDKGRHRSSVPISPFTAVNQRGEDAIFCHIEILPTLNEHLGYQQGNRARRRASGSSARRETTLRMSRLNSPVPELFTALEGSSTASSACAGTFLASTGNSLTLAPPLARFWIPT